MSQKEPFDNLAEFVFWAGLTAALVMIIGAAYITYPHLNLDKIFWPIVGVVSVMAIFLTTQMIRPRKPTKRVAGGHTHVAIDLNELRESLRRSRAVQDALEEHHGPRSTDAQPVILRRSDVSDQPWIDGKVTSLRTPDQYSRKSDRRVENDDYAEAERNPCASIDTKDTP